MILACTSCGVIYAPRNAPSACPGCHRGLILVSIDEALDLARARQDRMRAASRQMPHAP